MEEKQRNLIVDKLHQLIHLTKCNVEFLSILQAKQLLSPYEIQFINGQKTEIDQANIFYDIIKTRLNSFGPLLEALEKTNQSGALTILQESEDKSKGQPYMPRFVKKAPSYLDSFLDQHQDTKTILLIFTLNCTTTCGRICEILPTCKCVDEEDFLGLISNDTSFSFTPVVNGKDNWESILRKTSNITRKIILVTSGEMCMEKLNNSSRVLHFEEKMEWNDLTPIFQNKILNKLEKDFGMPKVDIDIALETIDNETLFDVVNGEEPKILKNNLPAPFPYYISRHVIPRHVITRAIFESQSNDIYLFKGIERDILSDMTNGQGTDTTSNILDREGYNFCRFLLLDHPKHFDEIVKRHKKYSVHVLNFEGDLMIWEKSDSMTKKLASLESRDLSHLHIKIAQLPI